MTTRTSSYTHNQMITALVDQYAKEGYSVKADHIGHPNGAPVPVNGHIPDVAAYSGGNIKIIAEAETCDSISGTETHDQWSAFSRSSYAFHVIVPKSCLEDAQNQARAWGISVDKWWWL